MTGKLETCKNCKWWWPNESPENKSQTLNPVFSDQVHWECVNENLKCCIDTKTQPSGASSYEDIMTGPDFGCIHFEVKLPF